MNWISGKIKSFTEKIKNQLKKFPTKKEQSLSSWISCCGGKPVLKSTIFNDDTQHTCPNCNKHYFLSPSKRFSYFYGKNNYSIIETPKCEEDVLNWPDGVFKKKLEEGKKKTKNHCSVVVAEGQVQGINITSFAVDVRHVGYGSITLSSGEAILKACQNAIDKRTPLVAWCAGGGQNLFQGAAALMMMTKTVIGISALKKNNLPYIIIYNDKCYGGITASFAAPGLGDFTFTEPAYVGFAGKNVVAAQTPREVLKESFQSSSELVRTGMCDGEYHRKEINDKIMKILKILLHKKDAKKEINDEFEATEDNPEVGKKVSA